jgi:SHS2 domain-containing protein
MKGYNIFSTTADVGLEIRGKTHEILYKNAIKGFFRLVTGQDIESGFHKISNVHRFDFRGDSCENVLVNLLSEIIFLIDSRNCIATGIDIEHAGEMILRANLIVRPLERPPELDIKSVTYHNLQITEYHGEKSVAIVFDI